MRPGSSVLVASLVVAVCAGACLETPPDPYSGLDIPTSSSSSSAGSSGAGGGASASGASSSATASSAGGGAIASGTGGGAMASGAGGGAMASGAGGGAMASGSGGGASASSGGGEGGSILDGDPPCEVLTFLKAKCWSCHGTKAHSETGLSLVTYQDLTAPSDEDPSKSNAERSIITMLDPADPMPPGASPPATQAEVLALQAWIDAGYPEASCGEEAEDPYAAPSQCSSGMQLDPNAQEGPEMNPGRACNACHEQTNSENGSDSPIFAFAGTVYPTAHEPDDCAASGAAGALVEIVDAMGSIYVEEVNAVGNFSFEDEQNLLVYPYTARLIFEGRERWMDTPQTSGDCNDCHNPAGKDDAPGRLVLP